VLHRERVDQAGVRAEKLIDRKNVVVVRDPVEVGLQLILQQVRGHPIGIAQTRAIEALQLGKTAPDVFDALLLGAVTVRAQLLFEAVLFIVVRGREVAGCHRDVRIQAHPPVAEIGKEVVDRALLRRRRDECNQTDHSQPAQSHHFVDSCQFVITCNVGSLPATMTLTRNFRRFEAGLY
jgi:hypothetical protein